MTDRLTVIERLADPLPGGRAQLVETTMVSDGEQCYTVRLGSPAARAVVAEHEETLTFSSAGVTRKRGTA